MNTYTPAAWVLVDITTPKNEVIRKVFAGWYGGYGGGDSWKLSSETQTVEDNGDCFIFNQLSGSKYVCHKKCNFMTRYMQDILAMWKRDIEAANNGMTIEVVDYES